MVSDKLSEVGRPKLETLVNQRYDEYASVNKKIGGLPKQLMMEVIRDGLIKEDRRRKLIVYHDEFLNKTYVNKRDVNSLHYLGFITADEKKFLKDYIKVQDSLRKSLRANIEECWGDDTTMYSWLGTATGAAAGYGIADYFSDSTALNIACALFGFWTVGHWTQKLAQRLIMPRRAKKLAKRYEVFKSYVPYVDRILPKEITDDEIETAVGNRVAAIKFEHENVFTSPLRKFVNLVNAGYSVGPDVLSRFKKINFKSEMLPKYFCALDDLAVSDSL